MFCMYICICPNISNEKKSWKKSRKIFMVCVFIEARTNWILEAEDQTAHECVLALVWTLRCPVFLLLWSTFFFQKTHLSRKCWHKWWQLQHLFHVTNTIDFPVRYQDISLVLPEYQCNALSALLEDTEKPSAF